MEFGDRKDNFNLDLYNLYQEMLKHDCYRRVQAKHRQQSYDDTGIPTDKDDNIKTGTLKVYWSARHQLRFLLFWISPNKFPFECDKNFLQLCYSFVSHSNQLDKLSSSWT